jgi:hypothetical protein
VQIQARLLLFFSISGAEFKWLAMEDPILHRDVRTVVIEEEEEEIATTVAEGNAKMM